MIWGKKIIKKTHMNITQVDGKSADIPRFPLKISNQLRGAFSGIILGPIPNNMMPHQPNDRPTPPIISFKGYSPTLISTFDMGLPLLMILMLDDS